MAKQYDMDALSMSKKKKRAVPKLSPVEEALVNLQKAIEDYKDRIREAAWSEGYDSCESMVHEGYFSENY